MIYVSYGVRAVCVWWSLIYRCALLVQSSGFLLVTDLCAFYGQGYMCLVVNDLGTLQGQGYRFLVVNDICTLHVRAIGFWWSMIYVSYRVRAVCV